MATFKKKMQDAFAEEKEPNSNLTQWQMLL